MADSILSVNQLTPNDKSVVINVKDILHAGEGVDTIITDNLETTDGAVTVPVANIALKDGSLLTSEVTSVLPATRLVSAQQADYININDYRYVADGSDVSLALKRILDLYSSNEYIVVDFPLGAYRFLTAMAWSGNAAVHLRGCKGTKLSLEAPGLSANLSITSVRRLSITELEIDIAQPTVDGAKVGVYLNCTGQDASHTITDTIVTATISTASRGVIAWDIVNPSTSKFENCYVRYFDAYRNIPYSNNIAWRLTATSKISTDSMFDNCVVIGLEKPYVVSPPVGGVNGAYLEGITWVGCTIVDCIEGPYIVGDSSNAYRSPMYRWIGGHISTYRRCFFAYWVSQIFIEGALFYLTYDSTLSGTEGRIAVWFEQSYENRFGGTGVHLFNQPDATNVQAVHVGPGCKVTHLDDITTWTPVASIPIVSYGGSQITRVRDCVCMYGGGGAPAAAISLNGTNDADLGGNAVYADS